MVADFRFWIRVQRDKWAKVARTKWWKLKGEVAQAFKESVINEGPWEEGGDAYNVWMKMATCIRKVASEEFGVSREVEEKLKIPGGGMMMSIRLLRRRKIVLDTFTWIGVQTT